jgi:8-oxo-dGTP pyrophosphatase MutT (NUDIX family)
MRIFYKEHILDVHISPADSTVNLPTRNELLKRWESSEPTTHVLHFPLETFRDQWLESQFTPIHAAGGLVTNDAKQILFMIRRGKWDLPKGKMESGEIPEKTALREIEEETGLSELTLVRPLTQTFHLYEENGTWMLKTSHWFLVRAKNSSILKPQLEEDITELHWLDPLELASVEQNTFANIKLVLAAYLKDAAN